MSNPSTSGLSLDDHEAESVEAVIRLHREHDAGAGRTQRVIDRFTDILGRPVTAVGIILTLTVGLVAAALQSGGALDGPLALWLELIATLAALLLAVLILVTQRRDDQFAARRAAMTLDLALLADRKNAKIIALLEELRRDAPQVGARYDPESEDMATPVDARALAKEIERRVD